jgi:hypothetical protein
MKTKKTKKTKKAKHEVHHWLRDKSMSVLPGDELLDKHLMFPRRQSFGPISVKGRYRLTENGKVTFDVEARPELEPVMKRLHEALVQENLLIARLRETVERPKMHPQSRRPKRLIVLILKTAVELKKSERYAMGNLANDVLEVLKRKDKLVSLRHVRNTLKDALEAHPEAPRAEALQSALDAACRQDQPGPRTVGKDEHAKRKFVAKQHVAARQAIDEVLDDLNTTPSGQIAGNKK